MSSGTQCVLRPHRSAPRAAGSRADRGRKGGARPIAALLLGLLAGCSGRSDPTPAATKPPAAPRGAAGNAFLVRPYLQLGNAPALATSESLAVLWHADDADADWAVDVATGPGPWTAMATPTMRRLAPANLPAHRIYRAELSGLVPGAEFDYRVRRGAMPAFEARGRARRPAGQPYRFVVIGDCGTGSPNQKAIAYRAYRVDPDFVVIPGDIVYNQGVLGEYRQKYFPIYNADEASPTAGAPLIRSVPFLAAPGNHDTSSRDLDKSPDGLAYFLDWDQPLNGPLGRIGAAGTPILTGSAARKAAFLQAAGPSYPRMANFSFDYGNAHWTMLDGNAYVDWTSPALRAWLERDLSATQGSTWRFVVFHQPGFHSSKFHSEEQRMRLLCGLFEAAGVDVVFSGHVHNYQRSYPLRFVARKNAEGKLVDKKGQVEGVWTLDRAYDGRARTRPDGILYLVTGAGGAPLHESDRQDHPSAWQEFTCKYVSQVHSLTVADVSGTTLTVRQLAADGRELDRFVVTKPAAKLPARPAVARIPPTGQP